MLAVPTARLSRYVYERYWRIRNSQQRDAVSSFLVQVLHPVCDLLLDAYARLDAQIAEIPADLASDEELISYVKAILRTIASAPDVIAVYFQEHPWLESSLTAEQATHIRAKEAEFTQRIREIIKTGMRANVFRRVNDELLSVQLLAMISSLYRWHLAENEPAAELVADTIVSYLFEGILYSR